MTDSKLTEKEQELLEKLNFLEKSFEDRVNEIVKKNANDIKQLKNEVETEISKAENKNSILKSQLDGRENEIKKLKEVVAV